MKNDIHKTFGEIFNGDIAAFRNQLLDIQHIQADRKKAEDWVSKLRFLDVSKVPNLLGEERLRSACYQPVYDPWGDDPEIPSQEIPVTEREDDDGDEYIAVSWRWEDRHHVSLYDKTEPPIFEYQIKRPAAPAHKSSFPDRYMDRVIRFAQSKSINASKLWIDKECIYQRREDEHSFPDDKEHGVQIMDVVYGDSTFSVGLLTVELAHEHEVDLLSELLQGEIFANREYKSLPKLMPGVDERAVQMLILRILSDPRWSRGWIFQEDHLASDRMILLMPCPRGIRKDRGYNFGDTMGELQVKLKDFRQSVTIFCMATDEGERRWPNSEILDKAKQYNIYNKIQAMGPLPHTSQRLRIDGDSDDEYGVVEVEAYPTTTNSVLDDICNRSLEHEEDRIAILANALRFTKRLNIAKDSPLLEAGQYSLSLALLALVLMNGEILGGWELRKDILGHTLQSYLDACQHEFTVPNLKYQQSFVDRCRFKSPIITPRGLKTKGFLFTLLPKTRSKISPYGHDPLLLTPLDREILWRKGGGPMLGGKKLNRRAHAALAVVVRRLNALWPDSKLASFINRHLVFDRRQRDGKDIPPSASYVFDMMSVLYQAVCDDDSKLRLARLASTPLDGEPVAIFVKPKPDGWMELSDPKTEQGNPILANVFTSWDSTRKPYNKDRAVSLLVDIKDGKKVTQDWDGPNCRMESLGCVYGVWCAVGEEMADYVFPLPGITDYSIYKKQLEGRSGGKRKRGADV